MSKQAKFIVIDGTTAYYNAKGTISKNVKWWVWNTETKSAVCSFPTRREAKAFAAQLNG